MIVTFIFVSMQIITRFVRVSAYPTNPNSVSSYQPNPNPAPAYIYPPKPAAPPNQSYSAASYERDNVETSYAAPPKTSLQNDYNFGTYNEELTNVDRHNPYKPKDMPLMKAPRYDPYEKKSPSVFKMITNLFTRKNPEKPQKPSNPRPPKRSFGAREDDRSGVHNRVRQRYRPVEEPKEKTPEINKKDWFTAHNTGATQNQTPTPFRHETHPKKYSKMQITDDQDDDDDDDNSESSVSSRSRGTPAYYIPTPKPEAKTNDDDDDDDDDISESSVSSRSRGTPAYYIPTPKPEAKTNDDDDDNAESSVSTRSRGTPAYYIPTPKPEAKTNDDNDAVSDILYYDESKATEKKLVKKLSCIKPPKKATENTDGEKETKKKVNFEEKVGVVEFHEETQHPESNNSDPATVSDTTLTELERTKNLKLKKTNDETQFIKNVLHIKSNSSNMEQIITDMQKW